MVPWLPRAAAAHPNRAAVNGLAYAELEARARAVAGGLHERGVAQGDRVALAVPSAVEFAVALHGCMLAGAVAVPIDLRLTPRERDLRLGAAKLILEEPVEGRPLAEVSALDLDATATLMHTSGTTAAARQVPLTYGNWLASALGSAVALGLDQEERWLCPMPLVHVGGLSIVIRSVIYGTDAVLLERLDAEVVTALLTDPSEQITLVSLVPTMLARLLDAGLRDPPRLRWALLGGGPIPGSLLDRAAVARVPVAPTYGMTEACSQIVTAGWPLPGVSLRIAADGEILVRGATVSAASLASDGWLHTGDLGSLDDYGRLHVSGRLADTIVSGGENVAPVEVEAVLLEHPGIADAAVHGRADGEWGEAVVATVVRRDGVAVDAGELRAFCAERLAPFKVPKAIQFVDRLPRSETGKLLRRQLR
jgi:O-succinylbenzoic acid--CoA ligase